MARDPARTRKLAQAQEGLIKAADALHEVDLRKAPVEVRAEIKGAREAIRAASTSVDEAMQLDVARAKAGA